jgi:hypothetical protein
MAIPKSPKPSEVVQSLDAFERVLQVALDVAEKNPDALPGQARVEGNPISIGPRVPEAADIASKMVSGAVAAGERWLKNVQSPRKNPIEAARAAKGRWRTRVTEAAANDAFDKGLAKVNVDEMMETVRKRGAGAFTQGVQDRQAKITRVVGEMRPMILALANTLDAMPADTDAQREAKAVAAIRGMREIGKRRRGLAT